MVINMGFCTNCGNQINDGILFCTNCGIKIVMAPNEEPQIMRTLTITRKMQFVACAIKYNVYVDDVDLGNIGVGKYLYANVNSDTVRVEIKTTNTKPEKRLWMLLKISQNTRIDFEPQIGGGVTAYISGAKILEQGN
ncbi:MAG: zinc ribbon domain-containing protein [Lachnospiraceae bacterium]|nr:zinc ribbon domain-containing protein [Lachnospiraceae bacterium]